MLTQLSQIINVYRSIIPQFSEFLNRLEPQDVEALKASYAI